MRLVTIAALAALVLGPATPALAQAAEDGFCRQLASSLPMLERSDDFAVLDEADGCTVSNGFVRLDSLVRYKFETLRLVAPDLAERLEADLPPRSVDISVSGIRVIPDIGDPLHEYVMDIQVEPFDVHLAYSWDGETGDLVLEDASLSGRYLGRLAISGRASGLTDAVYADARAGLPPALAIETLSVVLENQALFTQFIAAPLLYTLPSGEDPRPLIAAYQQQAVAMLEALPEQVLDAQSRDVLVGFIEAFPKPLGNYRLDLTFPGGLDPFALPFDDPAALLQNPPDLVIEASRPQ